MSRLRKRRRERKTLLVVGEGHTEVAFLNYLKTLYCRSSSSVRVKVENAHGKGPENVLNTAIRMQNHASYDCVVAVLDTDIVWTDSLIRKARENKVQLVGNTPCIEALFLSLLGHRPPSDTDACKKDIAAVLGLNLLDKNSYASWCTQERLESLRQTNRGLNGLLKLYEGVG